MNRRDAIWGLLALVAMTVPLGVTAQATRREKPFRIGTFPDLVPLARNFFSEAMRDLGWVEDRDFLVALSGLKWGERQLEDAIKRVVADKPDLILTVGTNYALTAHRTTTTIPIVMFSSGYPVEAGLAESLARPGKNVTGNALYAGTEVWGKLLQLLREVKPDINRISVLWTYVPPAFPREEIEPAYAELRNAQRSLGIKVHIVEAANADQVPAALAEIEAERPDALVATSGLAASIRPTVMQFAVKKHLPTITDFFWSTPSEFYPLLVYGPAYRELMRSAAESVDQILKGAKPGDLPIRQPAKFELLVDQRTAQAIGLMIPHALLLRADRVIE